MEADEEDRKIEEEENDLGRDQDDDFEYDLADDPQANEDKVDAKPGPEPPANGLIDINAVE